MVVICQQTPLKELVLKDMSEFFDNHFQIVMEETLQCTATVGASWQESEESWIIPSHTCTT